MADSTATSETTPPSILRLAGRQPFARGGKRDCFVHPDHPDRCVKVPLPHALPERLKAGAPWWRRWRKSTAHFDESYSDWKVLSRLQESGGQVLRHLPRCYGWVETDRGRGLVLELIRDADGKVSRSFLEYLWNEGFDASAQAAVNELAEDWQSGFVPSRSLGLHNLVARMSSTHMRLVLVDGFGATEFLPWLLGARQAQQAKARRKIDALKRDIKVLLERKRKGDPPGPYGFLLSGR